MNPSSDHQLVELEWDILTIMGKKKIRSVRKLRDMLHAVGVDVSSQQLGRIVAALPDKLNTEYLRGLLTVLECDITDLIRVSPPKTKDAVRGEKQVYRPARAERPAVATTVNRSKVAKDVLALPPGFKFPVED